MLSNFVCYKLGKTEQILIISLRKKIIDLLLKSRHSTIHLATSNNAPKTDPIGKAWFENG